VSGDWMAGRVEVSQSMGRGISHEGAKTQRRQTTSWLCDFVADRGYVDFTHLACLEYRNVLLVNTYSGPHIPSVHGLINSHSGNL